MKYDVTEAARKVRKILKANYPGHKFSVRVSRFAGGSSADISWADGPTQQQVEKLTDHLKGWDNGYRNEYIGISRKYTLEMMKAAAATAAVFYGIPVPHIEPSATWYTGRATIHPFIECTLKLRFWEHSQTNNEMQ